MNTATGSSEGGPNKFNIGSQCCLDFQKLLTSEHYRHSYDNGKRNETNNIKLGIYRIVGNNTKLTLLSTQHTELHQCERPLQFQTCNEDIHIAILPVARDPSTYNI